MTMSTSAQHTIEKKDWWETKYQANVMPWDLGRPAPPLETFLQSPYTVPPGSIAVLGCGTGHDCMLFANAGFQVTGVDFAPSAIQATYQKFLDAGIAGKTGFLLERNVFQMHDYDNYFDYVLEHNFLSSLHPSTRQTYIKTVRALLKPGGKLIALWWTSDTKGGPPFGIHKSDIFTLVKDYFDVDPVVFIPPNSVPQRKGKELFTLMTAK